MKPCSFPEGVLLPLLFCQHYIFSHLPWSLQSGFMRFLNTLAFVTLKKMHLNVIFVTMCPACNTLLIIAVHSNEAWGIRRAIMLLTGLVWLVKNLVLFHQLLPRPWVTDPAKQPMAVRAGCEELFPLCPTIKVTGGIKHCKPKTVGGSHKTSWSKGTETCRVSQ